MGRKYEYMSEAEQWVVDLWEGTPGENELYGIELAKEDLARFRKEWDDVPDDLTPELLMETWNNLALSSCEMVINADNRRVPRWSEMTNKQIAEVISDAYDWDSVGDLIDYVSETYIHLEKDEDGFYEDGWQDKVEEWCNQQ